ncbi:hypothetical protein N9767_01220 [Planktomarina temperata]|nr:hypothetical protein [Planktomarina temperata]
MQFRLSNICLSFDYELFFGNESGTVEQCLIYPTNKIKTLLVEYDVECIFFVDALYLLRLSREQAPSAVRDYKMICEQLRELYKIGVKIELHIHTHWLDATYDEFTNTWSFRDLSRYRLHALSSDSDDPNSMTKVFSDAKHQLMGIINPLDPKYSPAMFRAGGWCLEPFDRIRDVMAENEVFIDSSVAHDFSLVSVAHDVNFRGFPEKNQWNFRYNPREQDDRGPFTERVIASCRMRLLTYRIIKYCDITYWLSRKSKTKFGDGSTIKAEPIRKTISAKTTLLMNTDEFGFKILKLVAKRHAYRVSFDYEKDKLMTIGHPKLMSEYSMHQLTSFLRKCRK